MWIEWSVNVLFYLHIYPSKEAKTAIRATLAYNPNPMSPNLPPLSGIYGEKEASGKFKFYSVGISIWSFLLNQLYSPHENREKKTERFTSLQNSLIVVIDVLRAFTTAAFAFGGGAKEKFL